MLAAGRSVARMLTHFRAGEQQAHEFAAEDGLIRRDGTGDTDVHHVDADMRGFDVAHQAGNSGAEIRLLCEKRKCSAEPAVKTRGDKVRRMNSKLARVAARFPRYRWDCTRAAQSSASCCCYKLTCEHGSGALLFLGPNWFRRSTVIRRRLSSSSAVTRSSV